MRTVDQRANRLFIFLAGFFLTNALIGEFVGVNLQQAWSDSDGIQVAVRDPATDCAVRNVAVVRSLL